jgi:3-dehydroquinate synthase
VLPPGEATKSFRHLEDLLTRLLDAGLDRGGCILALGGGVVGDIAGFAAACYQRGIDFLQVPTTLLAQVDSSVGGKTGVNHPKGKNLIGAFYQPACVLADTRALATLGGRELRAGLAEVIKYGVLWDEAFFGWIEDHLDGLLARDEGLLGQAVRRSCEIKAEVVSRDEREEGVRARLNLGHTFGHAIEAGMEFGYWLHGEAVAAGMCMATDLAARMGWLSGDEAGRVQALVRRAGLPDHGPADLAPDTFLRLMARDKKALDGGIRLVLPRAIGDTVLTSDFDSRALAETLEACRADIEPPFFG